MADKKLQDLGNVMSSLSSGAQFVVGAVNGQTYRMDATVLQGFLLDPAISGSSIKAPSSNIIKTDIVDKITHYEFALLAPQSVFSIAHNRNSYITNIKFSSVGNNVYDGSILVYTEVDTNNVSFTLDAPLPTGAKIKIQFNL